MGVGRLVCVALPFILTAGSIISLLIAGLVGVTNNENMYMFRVNTTNLTISESTIENLLKISSRAPVALEYHDKSLLSESDSTTSKATIGGTTTTSSSAASGTITAADLLLADYYDVNLWGYCQTTLSTGNRTCTKAQFNWAETYLNTSALTDLSAAAGFNVTLPATITDSLTAFKTVSKWTEVVFIIAMVALGLELVIGFFAYCSRAVSCCTYLWSGVATACAIAAAAMVTACTLIVVGAVEGSAKVYGVTASLNSSFLACVWIGAAFALAASMFWLFSACCCKRDHHSKRKSHDDMEKPFLPTGAYAPLHDDRHNQHSGYGQQYGVPRHQNQAHRSDLAYEPYSHSNV